MGIVYVFTKPGNRICKIGQTSSPGANSTAQECVDRRLSTLQIGNDENLKVYRFFEVEHTNQVETGTKRLLRQNGRHIRGEWFHVTPDEAVEIVELAISSGWPSSKRAGYKREAGVPEFPPDLPAWLEATSKPEQPKESGQALKEEAPKLRRPAVRRRVVMDEPEHVMLDRVPSGALWAPQPEKPWNVWTQERHDGSVAFTRKLRDEFVVRYEAARARDPKLGEDELKAPIHADHAKLRREANLRGEVHDYKPYSCGGPEHDIWYCPKCRAKAEAAQAMPSSEEDEG